MERLRTLRRGIAALATLALAWALLPTRPADQALAADAPGTDTYRTVLGDAVNYGIVAETFLLESGDAQTNVAAVRATAATQTGNDLTNPVEQPFMLASIQGTFRIKGQDAYVRTNAADAAKLVGLGGTTLTVDTSASSEALAAEVRALLDHGASQSALLASRAPSAEIAYDDGSQKYVLDLRGRGAGSFYASVDDATYAEISREPSRLRIFTDEGQTVVLNVAGAATTMQKFDLNGQGSDAYLGKDAGGAPQTVVWNFPAATSLTIAGSVTGVVLAPRATVTVAATSSGWLVADGVVIGSGEWHNVYQEVEHIREGSTASFAAEKLVDGAPAAVDGFGFALELKDGDGWREVATAQSVGPDVAFGEQAYDEASYTATGDTQDFLYRIVERQGTVDAGGSSYVPDARSFYARVRVTRMAQLLPGGGTRTAYAASGPTYYLDEAGTIPLDGPPAFDNASVAGEPATATPRARKVMQGEELAAGAFTFSLRDAAGALLQTATNDADGTVAFEPLAFGRPGSHEYRITEDAGDDEAVIYDDASFRYVVEVTRAADGTLAASGSYLDEDGAPVEVPTFTNRLRELVVRAQKTSLEAPGTPLAGATYGLWQVGEGGAGDTHHGSDTSEADGILTFELPTTADATYYLLEEDAPYGHLIDPHPTDSFTIGEDEEGFYLLHEGDDELVRATVESTDGPLVLDYTPTANPVADHATVVTIDKLDRQTGARLPGATLEVIDKQTGEVVAQWESGEGPHELSRALDTERSYVLRETAAPAGYALAREVEFALHATGTQTTGEILSGETDGAGGKNAEMVVVDAEGVLLVKLYDARAGGLGAGGSTDGGTLGTISSASGVALPKTGDPAALAPAALAATLGALALVLGAAAHAVRDRRG